MGMFFTDAAIAFVKELRANLENIQDEHAEIQEQLLNYRRELNLFSAYRSLGSESQDKDLRSDVYVCSKFLDSIRKPVLLEVAIEKLSKEVDELEEQLEYVRKQEELTVELLDKLTRDYYPGILDEIKD